MAINRGKKAENPSVPTKLADMLQRAFSFQAIRDRYDAAFKAEKSDVIGYLESNDDGFSVDMGKGFKCAEGTVIYTSRDNWKFDTDKIIELVESGHITLATLVNIASFNAEKLKTAIGETSFNKLATCTTSESLTLRGSSEFKALCDEKFSAILPAASAETEVKPKAEKPKAKKAESKVEKSESSGSKAKAAAAAAKARSKSKAKDAASDLADILGE